MENIHSPFFLFIFVEILKNNIIFVGSLISTNKNDFKLERNKR